MCDLSAFLYKALTSVSSSTITAAAAVIIAFWNAHATRKHYRLSVRPKLLLNRKFRGAIGHYGIRLRNSGLGPAVIDKIAITVDGSFDDNSHSSWKKVLETVGLDSSRWHIAVVGKGAVIRTGEDIWLFQTDELEEEPNLTIRRLCKVNVTIKYSSFYGEKQPNLGTRLARENLIIEEENFPRIVLPATYKFRSN